MTTVAVTCRNGHQNPEHQHFCGECGAALPVLCPKGHQNAPQQHFCGECGAAVGESGVTDETRQASLSEAQGLDAPETPPLMSQRQDDPFDGQNPGGHDGVGDRLGMGDQVQVVDYSGTLDGMVGVVDEITDEDGDETVWVDFEHNWGKHAIRRDQLNVLQAGPQTDAAFGGDGYWDDERRTRQRPEKPSPTKRTPPQSERIEPPRYASFNDDPAVFADGHAGLSGRSPGGWSEPARSVQARRTNVGPRWVIAIAVIVVIVVVVVIVQMNSHSQAYKDCVSLSQSAANGTPGNTQQDLEHYCELTVGK
jgi:hypothetical protein